MAISEGTSSSYKVPIKTYQPIASVAALSERLRQLQISGDSRRPHARLVGGGVLDAPSRKAAVFAGSTLVIRLGTARLHPKGHFLALRAQGVTSAYGPRNDKLGAFTILTMLCTSCSCLPGAQGAPLQTQSVHTVLTIICANCQCLPGDCHVGLRPPRNDNSGGVYHFNDGLYGPAVPRRARLSAPLQRPVDGLPAELPLHFPLPYDKIRAMKKGGRPMLREIVRFAVPGCALAAAI